ncbi:MAG: hypothetical protein HYV63_29605 [Candidatus Schekmanbacteria bacterium]|nr:hypothetical protein [Candidatus Schekmanbacteria bacterium]
MSGTEDTDRALFNRRRYIRFDPDPLDVAYVELAPKGDDFTPQFAALVFQEAYGGCGLVVHRKVAEEDLESFLAPGTRCRLAVGNLDPIFAEVAWRETLDKTLYRIGFRYLE